MDNLDIKVGYSYGKEGHLSIIEDLGTERGGRDRIFLAHCRVCVKDSELHGIGNYKVTKDAIKNLTIPCGCSTRVLWTKDQIKILAERKCKEQDLEFLGFNDEYKNQHSKLLLKCNKHSVIWSTTSYSSLHRGAGCPECKKDKVSTANKKPDDFHISQFVSTGSFKIGTKFTRISTRRWEYTCPVCSRDKFVKAGLCTGVFTADGGHLRQGCLSCRCSSRFAWTRPQRQLLLTEAIDKHHNIDFVKWVDHHNISSARVILKCKDHGEWEVNSESFIRLGIGCPKCAHEATGDRFRTPKKDREKEIQNIILDEGLKYTFKGWVDDTYSSSRSKIVLSCLEHGEWNPTVQEFTKTGARCPGCAFYGFNPFMPAHLYVIRVEGFYNSFTGYGISNNYQFRFKTHSRNLKKVGFEIKSYEAISMGGITAQNIERAVKSHFPRHAQDVEGFVKEATYPYLYQEVIDFVKEQLEYSENSIYNKEQTNANKEVIHV